MGPGQVRARAEVGFRHIQEGCLVTLPAPRPQLGEHTLQELKEDFWEKELNPSSKPSLSKNKTLHFLLRGLR